MAVTPPIKWKGKVQRALMNGYGIVVVLERLVLAIHFLADGRHPLAHSVCEDAGFDTLKHKCL